MKLLKVLSHSRRMFSDLSPCSSVYICVSVTMHPTTARSFLFSNVPRCFPGITVCHNLSSQAPTEARCIVPASCLTGTAALQPPCQRGRLCRTLQSELHYTSFLYETEVYILFYLVVFEFRIPEIAMNFLDEKKERKP